MNAMKKLKNLVAKAGYIFLFALVFGVAVFCLRGCASDVSEHEEFDNCLDGGGVWDGAEKRCRHDCLTWNEKDGCVALGELQKSED